jgi:hypothetical protein
LRLSIERFYFIRLKNSAMLLPEVKGQDTQREQAQRDLLDERIKAAHQNGGFDTWQWAALSICTE